MGKNAQKHVELSSDDLGFAFLVFSNFRQDLHD